MSLLVLERFGFGLRWKVIGEEGYGGLFYATFGFG